MIGFTRLGATLPSQRFSRFILFAAACLPLLCALPITAQRATLARNVPQEVVEARAVRDVSRQTQMHLSIGLPLRNQAELDLLLAQISDPSSPNYHHFLTPDQFAARFSPTEQDYQALIQFAAQKGLTVTGTHSNRGVLSVTGAAPQVEKAFNVKMKVYSHPMRGEFYAPDREPSLDTPVKVLDISGLEDFTPPQPMSITTRPLTAAKAYTTGSGPAGYFIGKDFRAAYAPGVTLTGAGQTVGLLEFDGFFPGDVTKNFAQAGLPVVPTQTVLVNGVTGSAGGDNIEVILDIMMAAYMAPGLSKIIVYEGANPNDVLNRMATDNVAQQLSSSWGFGINATTEQIFKQFIAQGQSLLQASGDSGAYRGGVMTPSDDPNLTVVGGTSLSTSGTSGPWLSESTWSGSGGGISTVYAIPAYQQSTSMGASGGSLKMRNIPDVAMTADIQMFLIFNNGQTTGVGGTSAAAPLWAGFIALANQQAAANAKPRLGFLNPLIYAIGNSGNFGLDFNDIHTGSNGYSAVSGYDLATGWGSPTGQHLIYDLTGTSGAPSFALSTSAAALSIKPSTTATATLSVALQNGFKSPVTLAVTGLPAGVTAVFGPATTSTTSVLTLTAASTVVAGTYPLNITGTYGSLTSNVAIALTVAVPGFTLSSPSGTLTLPRGNSLAASVVVTGQNGFNSAVALTATGLPTAVTATFSPASTTSSSSLTFTAGATAVAGVYPITITGVSGTIKATETLTLTVTVPSFTLGSPSASLTLLRSSSLGTSVVVTGKTGFNSAVALTATGLPTAVTAIFSPASTTSSSVVTFTAGATATPGVYPVIITGVSGPLTASETVTITIPVPTFTLSNPSGSLTLPRGNSLSTSVVVNGQNGFNSAVALTATGLPAAVTATFSPASTTSSSILTFTAGTTAVAGAYPITVTGLSGTVKATATITITITNPTFTLSSPSAGLTLPRGNSLGTSVVVTGKDGFNSAVALTATGLPAAVTATFSPASTSSSSMLTFTAGATAVAGVYPITVTGVSGTLKATETLTITITNPTFTLSSPAASLTLPRRNSLGISVVVAGKDGFNSPVALTATGLPTAVTAIFSPASTSSSSVLTFTAGATAVAGVYPITVTGVSGALKATETLTLTITVPTFNLSFLPGNLALPRGFTASGKAIIAAQIGFNGSIALSTSALPAGVTLSAPPSATDGGFLLTFSATSAATAGIFPITVTAVSGTLSKSVVFTLTVISPAAGTGFANLASAYNVNALVTDGSPFGGSGLDGGINGSSTAYSANLTGVQQTIAGTPFFFGPANALDAVSAKTIALSSGQYTSLKLLATAVNGNQPAQVFKITYTDGSSSTFTQSVSDWFTPQNFAGETRAMTMPYRDNGQGQRDNRTFYLYEYSLTLNPAKTVVSITLPNNRNVIVLAATLSSTTSAAR